MEWRSCRLGLRLRARDLRRPLRAVGPVVRKPLKGLTQTPKGDVTAIADSPDPFAVIEDPRTERRLGQPRGGFERIGHGEKGMNGVHSGMNTAKGAAVNGYLTGCNEKRVD